jgi:hypothetical protein
MPTATINDLIPDVQLILQNRSDVAKYKPDFYLKKVIQELTQRYPFEELRVTGPQQSLTVGLYQYPISFFTNQGDDYTQVQSVNIFSDFPVNTVVFPLKYDTVAGIRPLTFIQGLPAKWTRFGGNFWVGCSPNQAYTAFIDYQRRHPFNASNLPSSAVFSPPEWHNVFTHGAAYQMALGPLRWPDMAGYLRTAIYGDPNDPREPGLIKSLAYQQEMDQRIHSRSMTVVTKR